MHDFTTQAAQISLRTEALTQLPAQGVPDDIYERVRTQVSEKEIPP